jgi:cyclopropane fatty-acyl-phospholipid synthase-like methyltransferase
VSAQAGSDRRKRSPSVARNREPLLEALRELLPERGHVLELASGTGEHAVHFARALPGLTWHPSDRDADARESVEAWRTHEAEAGLDNVRPCRALDVLEAGEREHEALLGALGPGERYAALVAINLVHIAPWEVVPALFSLAARVLAPGARVVLYGAYRRGGAHTSLSNAGFEEWLRSLDPRFGVRDLEAVVAEAERLAFEAEPPRELPANNLVLSFRMPASPRER